MDHGERKSFILPCGKTLTQSWAALRKAWLGFKIARSNGDTALMTHYASFIVKVQMEMAMPTTIFESNILDDEAIYEIIGRFCFNGKFVKNECTIEENGPDYDFMLDDTRSKMNHNAEHMIPPRQNIFHTSKKTWMYIAQEQGENKPQSKITAQPRLIEKSCKFIIPQKPPKLRGVGFCFRKYPYEPNEARSQDKIKEWEQLQIKIDEEVLSYYKYPDGANVLNRHQGKKRATEYKEKKSKRSADNTCFYMAGR